jgi:hypothetical protein
MYGSGPFLIWAKEKGFAGAPGADISVGALAPITRHSPLIVSGSVNG